MAARKITISGFIALANADKKYTVKLWKSTDGGYDSIAVYRKHKTTGTVLQGVRCYNTKGGWWCTDMTVDPSVSKSFRLESAAQILGFKNRSN